MKKIVFVLGMLALVSCGGGGQGDEITANNLSPQPSEGSAEALSIQSITGDGSAADRFASALIIKGANFADGMDVELKATSVTETTKLTYTLDSPAQIKASLPSDLDEGDFELTITKNTEKATASVKILRGEQGPTGATGATGAVGPQGPAGASGLALAAEFSCGLSVDIDNTATMRNGISVTVARFTDGSYFISCLSGYSGVYTDTSSYSTWYASNSVGVTSGKISCVPMYVTAEYSIVGQNVKYINNLDAAQFQTIACAQVYP